MHAAVATLDAEWLSHHMDARRPVSARVDLLDLADPVVREFREADADLHDLRDNLHPNPSRSEILAAERAAVRAWRAWAAVQRHAEAPTGDRRRSWRWAS